MSMDGLDIFKVALAQATAVVKQVRPEHFANATPDSEWNVRDLVGHMLYELSWTPDMVEGKTTEEVGSAHDGDLIGGTDIDLSVHWQTAADKADIALDAADPEETAHLSYGDVSIDDYLRQAGGDQFIHSWDLGKSIGVPVHFDVETAQAIYDKMLPRRDDLQKSGLFAGPLTVPEDADIQTKLLALFGRDAEWQQPSENS
jgi:uncharacterized protein (TIGR03086 family)